MINNGNKFWVFWGKLSALAVTLVALVTLYFQIFPAKSNLIVEGSSFNQYALPVDLIDRIKKIDAKVSQDSLEKYISEFDSTKKSKTKSEIKLDLLFYLSQKLRNELGVYPDKLNYYHGFLYFVIKNDGTKPSEDIYFSLPYNGTALITEENEKQSVLDFNKEIKIKELRPNQSIKIAIWTQTSYYRFDEDEIKISDKYGIGSVSMSLEVDGFAKFVARYLFLIVFFTIIAFVSLILFAWIRYPDSKETKNKLEGNEKVLVEKKEETNDEKST